MFRGLAIRLVVLVAALAGGGPGIASALDTSPWNAVIQRYRTDEGKFRYEALRNSRADRAKLQRFVGAVASAEPSQWSRDERLAFYINAYNALTVWSVLERWPVTSVMKEAGFFDGHTHRIAGQELTLDQLEKEVILGFGDPRVHFVVNCASASCPPLPSRALTSNNLEATLERQTRRFVRASTQVDRKQGAAIVSKIFEWYRRDFERAGGVRDFVAARLPAAQARVIRNTSTPLQYSSYDWSLNRP